MKQLATKMRTILNVVPIRLRTTVEEIDAADLKVGEDDDLVKMNGSVYPTVNNWRY